MISIALSLSQLVYGGINRARKSYLERYSDEDAELSSTTATTAKTSRPGCLPLGIALACAIAAILFILHKSTIAGYVTGGIVAVLTAETTKSGAGWLRKWRIQASTLGVAFVGTLVGSQSKVPVDFEYYKGMASLIPVLFLAFVVEQRRNFSESDPEAKGSQSLAFSAIALQCIAAIQVFQVLASGGRPTEWVWPPLINASAADHLA